MQRRKLTSAAHIDLYIELNYLCHSGGAIYTCDMKAVAELVYSLISATRLLICRRISGRIICINCTFYIELYVYISFLSIMALRQVVKFVFVDYLRL